MHLTKSTKEKRDPCKAKANCIARSCKEECFGNHIVHTIASINLSIKRRIFLLVCFTFVQIWSNHHWNNCNVNRAWYFCPLVISSSATFTLVSFTISLLVRGRRRLLLSKRSLYCTNRRKKIQSQWNINLIDVKRVNEKCNGIAFVRCFDTIQTKTAMDEPFLFLLQFFMWNFCFS